MLQCLTYTPPLAAYVLGNEHVNCRAVGFCALCAMQARGALPHPAVPSRARRSPRRHAHALPRYFPSLPLPLLLPCLPGLAAAAAHTQEHVKRALCGPSRSPVVSPDRIVKNLRSLSRLFRPGRQEDAHEFARLLMSAMHECLLPRGPGGKKLPPAVAETSFIYRAFGGKLRSQVVCLKCRRESSTYEPFLDLCLEINRAKTVRAVRGCSCFRAPLGKRWDKPPPPAWLPTPSSLLSVFLSPNSSPSSSPPLPPSAFSLPPAPRPPRRF